MINKENIVYIHAKEQYYHELETKNNLNNLISIPISIMGLVILGIAAPLPDLKDMWSEVSFLVGVIFSIFYFLAFVSVSLAIIFLLKHQRGLKYERVQFSSDLYSYFEDCYEYLSQQNIGIVANCDIVDVAEKYALYNMLEQYNKCNKINGESNDKKEIYYRRIKGSLIFAIIFLFISYSVFIFYKPISVYKAEIINLPTNSKLEQKMMNINILPSPILLVNSKTVNSSKGKYHEKTNSKSTCSTKQ